MKVEFLTSFEKDIDNIDSPSVLADITHIVELAETAKKYSDIPHIRKMKGFKTAFRIRVGDYRIGVYIEKGTIEFCRALPRKTIYKKFP